MNLTDKITEFETLSHANQEGIQPGDDKEFEYRWGEGYWKGIEFGKAFFKQAFTELIEGIKVEKKKMHTPEEFDNAKDWKFGIGQTGAKEQLTKWNLQKTGFNSAIDQYEQLKQEILK
jgi:hypothetical protein